MYVGLRYRIFNPRGGIDRVAGGTRTSAPMASATRFRSYMAYVARAGHVDRGLSFENDTFQPPGKNGRGSTYIGRIRRPHTWRGISGNLHPKLNPKLNYIFTGDSECLSAGSQWLGYPSLSGAAK